MLACFIVFNVISSYFKLFQPISIYFKLILGNPGVQGDTRFWANLAWDPTISGTKTRQTKNPKSSKCHPQIY